MAVTEKTVSISSARTISYSASKSFWFHGNAAGRELVDRGQGAVGDQLRDAAVRVLAERQLFGVAQVVQHVPVRRGHAQGQQPDDAAAHGSLLHVLALEHADARRGSLIHQGRVARHGVPAHQALDLARQRAHVPAR